MNWRDQLAAQVRPETVLGGVAAGAVLLLLAAFLYGVKPVWHEYRDAVAESASAAAPDPEEIARQGQRLRSLEARIGTLRGELYGDSATVPPEEIEAFVIDSLDALAVRERVELLGVNPGDPGEFLSFEELPYEIRLSGHYFDLFAWLGRVETELRPMIVKELHLRGEPDSDRVQMEMRLVTYRPGTTQ